LFLLANKQLPTKEEGDFYDYGISKDRIKNYPYSYVKLLDAHLKITEKFYQILENLEEEKFEEIPHEKAQEKLSDLIKRVALHMLGHTGQIVLIRRMFDNPFWSFVGGVNKENRKELREEWATWWKEKKEKYR